MKRKYSASGAKSLASGLAVIVAVIGAIILLFTLIRDQISTLAPARPTIISIPYRGDFRFRPHRRVWTITDRLLLNIRVRRSIERYAFPRPLPTTQPPTPPKTVRELMRTAGWHFEAREPIQGYDVYKQVREMPGSLGNWPLRKVFTFRLPSISIDGAQVVLQPGTPSSVDVVVPGGLIWRTSPKVTREEPPIGGPETLTIPILQSLASGPTRFGSKPLVVGDGMSRCGAWSASPSTARRSGSFSPSWRSSLTR